MYRLLPTQKAFGTIHYEEIVNEDRIIMINLQTKSKSMDL